MYNPITKFGHFGVFDDYLFPLEINSDVVSECIISNEERLLNCIDKKKPKS